MSDRGHRTGDWPAHGLVSGDRGTPQSVWRVLIVDDRESVREVLGLYADGRGLTVVAEAADGAAALAAAKRHHPHAVILDEEMPGRNGLDVLPDLAALLPDA